WCAGVVYQDVIERRGVHRRWRASIEDHAPARRIVEENDVRRQRDLDSDRRVFRDPARSGDAVVEPIVQEERIVRIFGEARPCLLRRERAGFPGMTRSAGTAIAAERLHIEEPSSLLKTRFRTPI